MANTRKILDEVYSNPANQPSPEYMEALKRLQAKAIRNLNTMDVFGMSSTQFDGLKSLASLETFEMTEQPETCRSCGARTRFRQVTDTKQFHQCPDCGNSYWVVEEES